MTPKTLKKLPFWIPYLLCIFYFNFLIYIPYIDFPMTVGLALETMTTLYWIWFLHYCFLCTKKHQSLFLSPHLPKCIDCSFFNFSVISSFSYVRQNLSFASVNIHDDSRLASFITYTLSKSSTCKCSCRLPHPFFSFFDFPFPYFILMDFKFLEFHLLQIWRQDTWISGTLLFFLNFNSLFGSS